MNSARARNPLRLLIAMVAMLAIAALAGSATSARADTAGPITFESGQGYTAGASINGQQGWSDTGGFDANVVDLTGYPAAANYGFGSQSLQISDSFTNTTFGDQTFAPALAQPAGESQTNRHFEASFQIGTALATEQSGLRLSVSPDNGQGGRMSYLRFQDQADGVHVFFDDVTDSGPSYYTPATFNETDIATLAHGTAHTIGYSMDLFPGPANDVVKISIDGVLKATGTTWEDYYRYDNEQTGSGTTPPTTSTMLFREGGTAHTANAGQGFLVDNLSFTSSVATSTCGFSTSGVVDTLVGDCFTDHTIHEANGRTLDGNGHTITAVDPSGGHFLGAVVQGDAGISATTVKNLGVTASGLSNNVCDQPGPPDNRLRGILFDNTPGTIANNNVHGVRQGLSGCQEGNAIEARNFASSPTRWAVSITNNTVTNYMKNAITANGTIAAMISGNTTVGDGPINYEGQNGIQVGFGATAVVKHNSASLNNYTPTSFVACGFLIYQAKGVSASNNTFFNNERNQCNFGKGGGTFKPATP